MKESFRVYLFGTFRLYHNDVLISEKEWPTRQARQLFKVLLREQGHVVPASRLIDLLWSEHTDGADKTLRSAISVLRTILEPGRDPHMPSRFIPRGRGGYTLVFPPACSVWIDTVEFERLLQTAVAQQDSKLLEAALSVYAGNYLAEDEEAGWICRERFRLRESYLHGVITLMHWYNDMNLSSAAGALGRAALVFDPAHEPLYRAIMRTQVIQGDNASALQTFELCRQALDEHLGADPSPQTLALHTAILTGEALPDLSPQVSILNARPRVNALPARSENPLFIGREMELQWCMHWLDDLHERRYSPKGRLAVLAGEAGVGKSQVAELVMGYARAHGIMVLGATCRPIEQKVSFASLVCMLNLWISEANDKQLHMLPQSICAQLVPLLPILAQRRPDLPSPSSTPAEQGYSQMITVMAELFYAISTLQPVLLCCQDVQWADELTLLVLNRLACTERVLPLLVLTSYRPEDVPENHALCLMLGTLSREKQVHTLQIERFSPQDVAAYLRVHHVSSRFSPESLYEVTQGNALYLAETVRMLLEQQGQERTSDSATATDAAMHCVLRSQYVRDVVLSRVTCLSSLCITVLEKAAVIGYSFPLDLLQPEGSEEEYRAIDILLIHRFLMEVHTEYEVRLSFSYEIVRRIVYEACSAGRRRWLHLYVAEQLIKLYGPEDRSHAAEIAMHYRKAGVRYALQAMQYTVEAGDYARYTYSYRQAIMHYTAATHLLEQLSAAQRDEDAHMWQGRILYGRRLASEALLDWAGVQESYSQLSQWAANNKEKTLLYDGVYRIAVVRALMGHLADAVNMERTIVENVAQIRASDSGFARNILDMIQHWARFLTVDVLQEKQFQHPLDLSHFPRFHITPPPAVQNWDEVTHLLGATEAAFILTLTGWVLITQGYCHDAEQCLNAALRAAEESHQMIFWILSSLYLSMVYHQYGLREECFQWLERCLSRGELVAELAWITIWPRLTQTYIYISVGRLDEADRLLHSLEEQLAPQSDFMSYRNSVRIGFGLLALARGELKQAEALLGQLSHYQPDIYIDAYVQAEIGLARIAEKHGDRQAAYVRLYNLLSLCQEHSLLHAYCEVALTLVRLSLHMERTQGLVLFLEEVYQLAKSAYGGPVCQVQKSVVGKIPLSPFQ